MSRKKVVGCVDECLQLMGEGETSLAVLARYPAEMKSLGPELVTAERLQELRSYRLPETHRARAKAALAAAWVTRVPSSTLQGLLRWLSPGWVAASGRRLALALLLVVLLLVPLTATTIAASHPGSIGYAARVEFERVPVLLLRQAAPRASAELAIADRRLTDLDTYLQRTGQLAPAALKALLRGQGAAVAAVSDCAEASRSQIGARIALQAGELARLAESAGDRQAQVALRAASAQAGLMAARLGATRSGPDGTSDPGGGLVGPSLTPTRGAAATQLAPAGPVSPARGLSSPTPRMQAPVSTRTPEPPGAGSPGRGLRATQPAQPVPPASMTFTAEPRASVSPNPSYGTPTPWQPVGWFSPTTSPPGGPSATKVAPPGGSP